MYNEATKAAYPTDREEDYVDTLGAAKSAVNYVNAQLDGLISAIRGPRPEPASDKSAGLVGGKRSLKDALDHTPDEIRELCARAEKQIAEIRALLRL